MRFHPLRCTLFNLKLQVAISHLAWAVGKRCSSPPPEKVHEGDYWTQHAKNFIDIREREIRPATAEASKEHVHKVAVGILNEIKTAAFEDGNATALKVPRSIMIYIQQWCESALIALCFQFIANYGRDLRRRTRQILKPANMEVDLSFIVFVPYQHRAATTICCMQSRPCLQNIQNTAGLGAHFPVHHTDVTEMTAVSYTHLPLHLPQQAHQDFAHRNSDITRHAVR